MVFLREIFIEETKMLLRKKNPKDWYPIGRSKKCEDPKQNKLYYEYV